jgi:hypothetical protein
MWHHVASRVSMSASVSSDQRGDDAASWQGEEGKKSMELLQLPHLTEREVKHITSGKARVSGIAEYIKVRGGGDSGVVCVIFRIVVLTPANAATTPSLALCLSPP